MLESSMRVSVIIPLRNGARFLDRCLASALGQSRAPDEILVIDDGSTDGGSGLAANYGREVTWLSQDRQGPAAARNRGLEHASGDVIAFLDADDWWEVDKLRRQLAFLRDHPDVGLVHTATTFVDAARGPVVRPNARFKPQLQGRCLAELIVRNAVTTSSVAIRRAAIGTHRFDPSLPRASDWDLWLKVAQTQVFAYIDEPLTNYFIHDANISHDAAGMLESSVQVMSRALERGLPPREARLAERARNRFLMTLGHHYYEQGRWLEARRAFWSGRPLREDWTAVIRGLSTFLPRRWHARARTLWRRQPSGARSQE